MEENFYVEVDPYWSLRKNDKLFSFWREVIYTNFDLWGSKDIFEEIIYVMVDP